MASLGKTLVGLGRYAEAERQLRQTLSLPYIAQPNGVFAKRRARLYLGLALAGQERYAEAEPLLKENYSTERLPMGFVMSDLQMASRALMKMYEAQGRVAEAATYRLPDSLRLRGP